MNRLIRVLSSSIGKKLLMGLTGLSLCGFLVVHLAGNLLLYVGPQAYNDYAHSLHENSGLLLVGEIGLLVLFAAHIALWLITARENFDARGSTAYAVKQSKQAQPAWAAANTMAVTGVVVLLFVVLHLADFRFELRNPGPADEAPFAKAGRLLVDPLTTGVYIVGSLVLAYHVSHGFQSAFRSLGIEHPQYTPLIVSLGMVFAVLVGLGFASFPVWAWLQK